VQKLIFGGRSDQELKYAKAKAKAAEFRVDDNALTSFPLDSDELHYTSVYAISSYTNARIAGASAAEYQSDLRKVASFYDAASNDKGYAPYSDGYWLLAMAAYFLVGNFGSAKVAASHVKTPGFYGEYGEILHSLISFLLIPDSDEPKRLIALRRFLRGEDVSENEVYEEASAYLHYDNPEDAFFGKVLFVAIGDAIASSSRKLLPSFTGVQLDKWRSYLAEDSSSKLLWQAQRRIGEAGVLSGTNAFIQLPTGTGKTKSIEILLRARILSGSCRMAVIVAPLRALCAEIANELGYSLKGVAVVQLASDVLEIDPWLSSRSGEPNIMVFTPEKLGYVLHHEPQLIDDADLFVFDEAHLLDDESRGPNYELLLTEIFQKKPDAQRVMISAVVSNPQDISHWAFGDNGKIVSDRSIQVTEKAVGYFSRKGRLVNYVDPLNVSKRDYFLKLDIAPTPLAMRSGERRERVFPDLKGKANAKMRRDLAIYYANRLLPNGACAIYVPKKASISPLFDRIDDIVARGGSLANLQSSADPREIGAISKLIEKHYGINNSLSAGVLSGILPHYGDLQGAIRQSVEYAVEHGLANCIACTSTLAEGVNLPIKYLLVTDVMKSANEPKTRDFQNLAGRTARSGKFSEGSVLVIDDILEKAKVRRYSRLFDPSIIEECKSSIGNLLADAKCEQAGRVRTIPGNQIASVILEHLDDSDLEQKLAVALKNSLGCNDYQARELSASRVKPLEAIESYLSSIIDAGGTEQDVMETATSTFAYSSADDAVQEQLLKLFQAIYEHLSSEPKPSLSICSKTRVGLRKTDSLLSWTSTQSAKEFFASGCVQLNIIVNEFLSLRPDLSDRYQAPEFTKAVEMWIEGYNLLSIQEELKVNFASCSKLSITKTERLASNYISYSFGHFISCLIDVVSSEESDFIGNVDQLQTLQRKVKYGVPNVGCSVICEKVLDDRIVAFDVVTILDCGTAESLEEVKLEAQAHREALLQYANGLPSFCAKRLKLLLR
jgi:hypothetical protein